MVQTPTEALASGTDPISEAQKGLDGTLEQKPEQAAPEYVTKEQYEALQKQFQQSLAEVRGVQGKLDRVTNVLTEREKEREEQRKRALMESIPEEARAYVKPLYDEIDKLKTARTPEPEPPAPKQDTAVQPGEDAKKFVRKYGVDPDDPRLDYKSLYDASLPEEEREVRFVDSIYSIKSAKVPTPGLKAPKEQAQTQPEQARVVPPSAGNVPAGNGAGAYRTESDVTQAYITGQIDSQKYHEERARLRSQAPKR